LRADSREISPAIGGREMLTNRFSKIQCPHRILGPGGTESAVVIGSWTSGPEFTPIWIAAAIYFLVHGAGAISVDHLLIGREF
jgi:hypothetical protein